MIARRTSTSAGGTGAECKIVRTRVNSWSDMLGPLLFVVRVAEQNPQRMQPARGLGLDVARRTAQRRRRFLDAQIAQKAQYQYRALPIGQGTQSRAHDVGVFDAGRERLAALG